MLNDSDINATAGAASLSISVSQNQAVAAGLGLSLTVNDIANTTRAAIEEALRDAELVVYAAPSHVLRAMGVPFRMNSATSSTQTVRTADLTQGDVWAEARDARSSTPAIGSR